MSKSKKEDRMGEIRVGSVDERPWSLDERVRAYPQLRARFEALLAVVENASGDAVKADEAEQRVIEELRQMGQEALQAWAQRKQGRVEAEYDQRRDVTRKSKKNSTGIRDSGPSR
jgi:hypothetical protein